MTGLSWDPRTPSSVEQCAAEYTVAVSNAARGGGLRMTLTQEFRGLETGRARYIWVSGQEAGLHTPG